MNTALKIYTVLYAIVCVGGLYDDVHEKAPAWQLLVNVFVCLASFAGLVLFQLNVNDGSLRAAWIIPFVGYVVGGFILGKIDLQKELKEHPEDRRIAIVLMVLFIAFEIPCFVVNYLFAFSSFRF